MSAASKIFFDGIVAQLVFWVCVRTVGTGMIAGLIVSKIRSPKTATA